MEGCYLGQAAFPPLALFMARMERVHEVGKVGLWRVLAPVICHLRREAVSSTA